MSKRIIHTLAYWRIAIYHLHVKVIGRKAGSSAVVSTSYRSAIAAAVKEQSQLLQQGHKIQFGRTHIDVS